MALLTAEEFKAQVQTTLANSVIDDMLDREQAALERLFGPAYDGSAISETFVQESRLPGSQQLALRDGEQSLFVRRRIEEVTSITEKRELNSPTVTLAASDYYVIGNQGRILRLNQYWGAVATVLYIPQDDSAEWKRALLELGRTVTQRTVFKSENIAGEYSYTAPDNWDHERTKILQGLGFFNI